MIDRGNHVDGRERRSYVRARVVATATVWARGLCKGSYIVENLSLGGVYVSGGPAVRVGEDIKVILELPRGPVEVRGKVLRSETGTRDCTLAIRFEATARRTRDAIGSAVADALEAASRDASVRPEPTVLVVDDSLLVRESLTRDLRCAGWEVACFSTSLDALDFLDRPDSQIRVALIDLVWTRGNDDLLRFLADERPRIRRVLMADRARSPGRGEPLDDVAARADAVLPKPWNAEALATALAPQNEAA